MGYLADYGVAMMSIRQKLLGSFLDTVKNDNDPLMEDYLNDLSLIVDEIRHSEEFNDHYFAFKDDVENSIVDALREKIDLAFDKAFYTDYWREILDLAEKLNVAMFEYIKKKKKTPPAETDEGGRKKKPPPQR